MKFRGASLLELSLTLSFALIVLVSALYLVQESTDRINKAILFQAFTQDSTALSYRATMISDWNWDTSSVTLDDLSLTFI